MLATHKVLASIFLSGYASVSTVATLVAPANEIPVGNVDNHGFIRLELDLPDLFGVPGKISNRLIFSTNSLREPPIFGGFWSLEIANTKATLLSKLMFEWRAPNGMTYFFSKKGGRVFRE